MSVESSSRTARPTAETELEYDYALSIRYLLDVIADTFYPVYDRLFDRDSTFVVDLENKLSESRMPQNVELYLSMAIGLGVLGGLTLAVVGVTIGFVLFGTGVGPLLGIPVQDPALVNLIRSLRTPFVVLTTGLVFGLIGFWSVIGLAIVIPYQRSSRRRREINLLLPDAVSFMYALSVGGMSQLEILDTMAESEDTYGEVAREFRTIVQETAYFDTDYRSAIRQQAIETPSDDLSQFLTDMLSVIDSGGDLTRFLKDKKNQHFRTAKQEQQKVLETLELFGEIFVTISLFPLLLIIVLVVLSILGKSQMFTLYATVYGLIPLTGLAFLVLVSTVKQDDPGDGVLHSKEGDRALEDADRGVFDRGLVKRFQGAYYVFDRIARREGTYRAAQIIKRPDHFFRDHPTYTMAVTVPAASVIVVLGIVSGSAPTTWSGLVDAPVWGTFIYVYAPLLLVGIPLAVFREWNVRSRKAVMHNLSDNLRKLSSANDTGLTLLESIRTVADTSSGRLTSELDTIYVKCEYGMNVKEAFIVFNNKYKLPRLARTVKLVSRAQEVSSQISEVLSTAAQATENQDEILRERKSRTRMQVVLIITTYLVLLAVMAVLKLRFLDVLSDLSGSLENTSSAVALGSGFQGNLMSLLFFHAVTLQAIISGFTCGYMRDAEILSGMKYVVGLLVITLATWVVVT